MKVYAKQVPPEFQESPLFIPECFPENIAVCGNRDFISHKPEVFERVQNVLEQGELAEVMEHPKEWANWYKNATEAINEYLPATNGKKYSPKKIHALRCLVIDYSCCVCSKENEILCKVLSIVTGKKWDNRMISGCCQSDWNYIFYPVDEWTREQIEIFETEYFNTGTEWIIHDEAETPETSENINGYSVYCIGWDSKQIRNEIAEVTGAKPEEIKLFEFGGYTKTPFYKEV